MTKFVFPVVFAAFFSTTGVLSNAAEVQTAGPLLMQLTVDRTPQCKSIHDLTVDPICYRPKSLKKYSIIKPASVLIEEGIRLFQARKFDESNDKFALAIHIEPDDFRPYLYAARYELGRAYLNGDFTHFEKTDKYLQKAEKLAPSDPDVLSTRASMLLTRARDIDAFKIYDTVLLTNPSHIFALKQRAQIFMDYSEFESALADYKALIDLDPKNALWRTKRGRLSVKLGYYKSSIGDLSTAIQINKYNKEAYLLRASAFAKLGNAKSALADYKIVLEGFSKDDTFIVGQEEKIEILARRTFLLHQLKQYDQAVSDALTIAAVGGKSKVLRLQLFLKRQGYKLRIDGKESPEMRQAIKDCFSIENCAKDITKSI